MKPPIPLRPIRMNFPHSAMFLESHQSPFICYLSVWFMGLTILLTRFSSWSKLPLVSLSTPKAFYGNLKEFSLSCWGWLAGSQEKPNLSHWIRASQEQRAGSFPSLPARAKPPLWFCAVMFLPCWHMMYKFCTSIYKPYKDLLCESLS